MWMCGVRLKCGFFVCIVSLSILLAYLTLPSHSRTILCVLPTAKAVHDILMRPESLETFQCLFCTHDFVLTAAEMKYSNGFQSATGQFVFGVLSWRNNAPTEVQNTNSINFSFNSCLSSSTHNTISSVRNKGILYWPKQCCQCENDNEGEAAECGRKRRIENRKKKDKVFGFAAHTSHSYASWWRWLYSMIV